MAQHITARRHNVTILVPVMLAPHANIPRAQEMEPGYHVLVALQHNFISLLIPQVVFFTPFLVIAFIS